MTREEAIKWIDDRMCFGRGTFTEHHPPNIDECWQAGMMAIDALSAESVEVVRCGECKHMIADGRCMKFADDGIRPSASDFCSYGERKGGDDE